MIINKNDLWEAISSTKSKKIKFDIYRNGKLQESGAYKQTDIKPTIKQLIESQKEADEFLKEWKSQYES